MQGYQNCNYISLIHNCFEREEREKDVMLKFGMAFDTIFPVPSGNL